MATVYWAPFIKPSLVNEQGASLSLLNFSDPVKLVDELSKEKFYDTHIIKCSSFVQHIKNTYVIKSPIEVDLEINDENQYRSTLLDYNLNSYINVFDLDQRLISFGISYLFFSEQDVTLQLRPCYYHDNNFINDTDVVGGDVNISKWFRPTDCAFFMKNNYVRLNYHDPAFYINFHTADDSIIKLQKFHVTEEIQQIAKSAVDTKNCKGQNVWPLKKYYKTFLQSGYNKRLVKLIKNNLI